MHNRLALAFIAHCLIAAPVCAMETFDCADPAGNVSVEYDYQYDAPNPFTRIQMQIEGDIGISTDPAHPDNSGEYISDALEAQDFKGVDIDWKDDNGQIHTVMRLRLVEVSEGQRLLQTGGLSVGGGGIWSIACSARGGEVIAW